jgi:hypothetical protein
LSTSFLVIQAQRDLAQARTNELSARLAHAQALVDFEALQEAGPEGQPGGQGAPVPAGGIVPPLSVTPAAVAAARSSSIF